MKKHVVISAITFLVCTVLVGGVALAVLSIEENIHNQQHRIEQGIASGRLTPSEADVLQGNLNYIRDSYSRAVSNGYLSPDEDKRLRRMLYENSMQIEDKKHNKRRLY